MSKALFEKEFTTHSIRRSAARWAARCGADDSDKKMPVCNKVKHAQE